MRFGVTAATSYPSLRLCCLDEAVLLQRELRVSGTVRLIEGTLAKHAKEDPSPYVRRGSNEIAQSAPLFI
jgi:hypothetical protein